jgi:membrane protein DedA with SNARE-associated domain
MQWLINWLDEYVDGIQVTLQAHVVLAPLLLLLIEETGFPLLVPGDAIIAYVGYGLRQGGSTAMWQAFIIAVIAILIGSSILFYLSKRYGQLVIRLLARFMFIKQKHITRAEKLFARYGVWAIIIGRHIPGMRIPVTIFAASSGISYVKFILSTFVSTFGWVILYLEIGSRFGGNFIALFRDDAALTASVVCLLAVLMVGMHLYGYWQAKKQLRP